MTNNYPHLITDDREIFDLIASESQRQNEGICLIPSENRTYPAVLEALGTCLTDKYAEGYSGKRYYGGCEFIDKVEDLANERLQKIFNAKYSNVQPHCGSSANMAVFRALINPGDTCLALSLDCGGHLTHGKNVSFSGKDYNFVHYGVDKNHETLDYLDIMKLAKTHKPKLIIAGGSAYPRRIDFKLFRNIADEVGAYFMVDMAHIAGLIAAELHMNPVDYAHVVTSTTHKTLRGPRGGIILTNDIEIAKKIDKVVFPEMQGGPLMNVIAAKAVAFNEALKPEFKEYQKQVIENAETMANRFKEYGYRLVSDGTDTHLMLIDTMSSVRKTGAEVEKILNDNKIYVNKNTIPFDQNPPRVTSGIRLGTPYMTATGAKEKEIVEIVDKIHSLIK